MRRLAMVLTVSVSAALVGCGSRSDTNPQAQASPAAVPVAPLTPSPDSVSAAGGMGAPSVPEPATTSGERVSRDARPPQSFEVDQPTPRPRRSTPPPARRPAEDHTAQAPAPIAPPAQEREQVAEAPRPAPTPAPIVLASNSELTLELDSAIASDTAKPGQRVTARITRVTTSSGPVNLPSGSYATGVVRDARESGRVSGRARVTVVFDHIVVGGQSFRLDASPVTAEAASSAGHDVKVAGGATAAGAVIGAILGGGKGAAKGAAVGAAAGGAAVLMTRGDEVVLPAGSHHTVRTQDSITITSR